MKFNRKGSILVLTLTFVLIFSLLGTASIYYAGRQNELAEKKKFSSQAFWLADAAVERAKSRLPVTFDPDPVDPSICKPSSSYSNILLGEGAYDIASCLAAGYHYRWTVNSKGTVKGYDRRINAVIAAYNIPGVVNTQGSIKNINNCPMASVTVDCSLLMQYGSFSLNTFFNGLTIADIKSMASYTYTDPKNAGAMPVIENITVVNLINKHTLQIPSDHLNGSGFLLVDTTGAGSSPVPQLSIEGSTFNGIIWVLGEAKITGNAQINGAIFVEGSASNETTLGGTITLTYDPVAIDLALVHFGLNVPAQLTIVSWQEL